VVWASTPLHQEACRAGRRSLATTRVGSRWVCPDPEAAGLESNQGQTTASRAGGASQATTLAGSHWACPCALVARGSASNLRWAGTAAFRAGTGSAWIEPADARGDGVAARKLSGASRSESTS